MMKDEGRETMDGGRGTRDEGRISIASVFPASKASGRTSTIVIMIMLFTVLTSCGYRFTPVGGVVPQGVTTIAIPSFVNGTNEPSVDVEVTKAVVDEFLADGRLKIVDSEEAELVLRGKVVRYEVIPLSYTVASYVQQYKLKLVVEASIEDRKTNKILWQEKNIESIFISDYPVSYETGIPSGNSVVNIQGTKISKEGAIKKASRDIAWTLRSRVLEGF